MLFLALNMYVHFRNCKKEDTLPLLFLHVEMGIISIFILFYFWLGSRQFCGFLGIL